MKRSYLLPLAVAGLASLTLTACTTGGGNSAVEACEDFPNDPITIVVPFDAGGGFDTWARVVASNLPRFLPEGASTVVENRPGAGGLSGVTEVYISEPDGYTMVITEPGGLATAQLAGQTEIDITNFEPIGRVAVSPEVIVVASDSEYQSIDDLRAAASESDPALMATSGLAAVNIVSFDALGIPYDSILHDGSSEAVLSLLRGDTDVSVFTLNSQLEGLRNGDIRALAVIGTPPAEGEAGFEEVNGVPTLDEIVGNDGLGSALEQHRLFFAPPGTPACAVEILSDALVETLNDETTLAAATEAGQLPPSPLPAAETKALVANVLEQLREYIDLLEENLDG